MKEQRRRNVKKLIMILMILTLVFVFPACRSSSPPADNPEESLPSPKVNAEDPSPLPDADEHPVMSYQDFLASEIDCPVTVDAYVQAKEPWQNGHVSLYAQNRSAAYYLDRMNCSRDECEKLEIGQKIRISGYKSLWNDSLSISDAAFQLLNGNWIAEARDVTAMIGTDELIQHQNEKVCFRGMTVEAMPDGLSVWYSGWDNSAPEGADSELWFRASYDGTVCEFTIRPSLCPDMQELLQTLQAVRIGDRIDLTGYLRYVNGPLPCITEIQVTEGNFTEPS